MGAASSMEDSFWNQIQGTDAPAAVAAPAAAPAPVRAAGPGADIEAVALSADKLPVKLPRGTCSIPAENLLRTLGRNPRSADPWVPVGTLGPLIIMAHCRTDSRDYWGIPAALVVPIVIEAAQYDSILKDLYTRIGYKPLEDSNPVERMVPPPSLFR